MMVVTGAAGFIGSCLVSKLNSLGFNHLVLVDDFTKAEKHKNLEGKKFVQKVDREDFVKNEWLKNHQREVEFVFHIGARTDTTEFNMDILNHLNVEYTKKIWNDCVAYQLPLIYASSAATYGLGELGYDDNEALIPQLKPLNPYGVSKNEFDIWALKQEKKPFFWAGLKFFNVYGANEYHKGRMASVIFHAYHQIKRTNEMKLFHSHHPDYKDGEQKRDFIYVQDLLEVIIFLMHHRKNSGIYNLGTGQARTFLDLARNTFKAMGIAEKISFIDTPLDIRDKYQYFTEANMSKIRGIGYTKPFTSLEDGVKEYVQNYLMKEKYF